MDPKTGESELVVVAGLGEIYQMLADPKGLLMAAYGAFGGMHLLDYRADQPVSFAFDVETGRWISPVRERNPRTTLFPSISPNWRPKAMVRYRDGNLYMGGMPGYGQRGGWLVRFEPHTGQATTIQVSPDQSIASICLAKGGLMIGTSLEGGTGSKRAPGSARVILWDPATSAVLKEWIPVPGASQINDLVCVSPDVVVGIGGGSDVFRLDVVQGGIQRIGQVEGVCRGPGIDLYNCAGIGPDGNIYGLVDTGVFTVNTRSWKVGMYCLDHEKVTSGFVILGDKLFYASGAEIKRVELP